MRAHLFIMAAFGLALATSGCSSHPTDAKAGDAAKQQTTADNTQRNCANTGSRLGSSCSSSGGRVDAQDMLRHSNGSTKLPGS